jgi:hypothetical protein
LAAEKLTDRERELHAVIYSSNQEPDVDDLTTRPAIAVDPKSKSDTLHPKSRLHLGKLVPIERNTRVRYHGDVKAEDFKLLKKALLEILTEDLGE